MITWSDELFTGNSIIDEEHKQLIELLNAIGVASAARKRKAFKKDLVEKMLILTRKHCITEQRLMFDYKYEMIAHHTAEHGKMLSEFEILIVNYDEHGSEGIASFFESWFANHLFSEDMRMARWIQFHQCLGLIAPQ